MPLPDVTITVQDGGLGTMPASAANAQVKIGVWAGPVGVLQGFSDTGTLSTYGGQGQLVEAIASTLKAAGGPVYGIGVNPSQAGSFSSVVQAGGGAGTVAPSAGAVAASAIKIVTGGAVGVANYVVSPTGTTGPFTTVPVLTSASATPLATQALTQITFPAGTYVAGDVYAIPTSGVVTRFSGTGTPIPTITSSPVDAYSVQVSIKSSATVGASPAPTFTYSLDGGNSVSPVTSVPTSGVFVIPGAGIILTFAGALVSGDLYSFTTVPAGYTTTDLTAAFTALLANNTQWGFVHVVGSTATSAGAAAVAAVAQTQIEGAAPNFRFARAVTECPSTETDTVIQTSFASFASTRVAVGCGDANMVSPLTGRIIRRNPAWALTNRLAAIQPGEDPAYVGRGSVGQVASLVRDEFVTPALDGARFVTLRTFPGMPGYYITNGRLMAPGGSDFQFIQLGRVMDRACLIVRQALAGYVNGAVRVDATTGFIDPRDAARIEQAVNAQLSAGVVATGDASSSTVTISRTTNILSTNTEPVTVRIVPLGYLKTLQTNIGFMNPALQTS
jgi:Protein of unknown function (DUF2586)